MIDCTLDQAMGMDIAPELRRRLDQLGPAPREIHTPCPDCGYDGPHRSFSINEYSCESCCVEFSYHPRHDEDVQP